MRTIISFLTHSLFPRPFSLPPHAPFIMYASSTHSNAAFIHSFVRSSVLALISAELACSHHHEKRKELRCVCHLQPSSSKYFFVALQICVCVCICDIQVAHSLAPLRPQFHLNKVSFARVASGLHLNKNT